GLAYYTGPFGIGTFFSTATGKGDPTIPGNDWYYDWGLGGQYTMAPGWILFTAVDFVKVRNQLAGVPVGATVSGAFLGAGTGTTVSSTYSHVGNNSPTLFSLGTQIFF